MILGVDRLLKLVKTMKLVENLCDRELTNPEGCGFDLRLGQVHKIEGEGFMGVTERCTPNSRLVNKYVENEPRYLTMQPQESYLVTTLEKVNMPPNLAAHLWARSTLYRSGIILSGGNIDPGYNGELSFTLFNSGNCNFKIELGARIVHIQFFQVDGKTNLYRGQWKDGRITAKNKEKQV